MAEHVGGMQVGGGPTGVELAAEMHDYIKEDLSELFPSLKVSFRDITQKQSAALTFMRF